MMCYLDLNPFEFCIRGGQRARRNLGGRGRVMAQVRLSRRAGRVRNAPRSRLITYVILIYIISGGMRASISDGLTRRVLALLVLHEFFLSTPYVQFETIHKLRAYLRT